MEAALVEFRRLETRCDAETGGWVTAVKRRLFATGGKEAADFDRLITLADASACVAFLTAIDHRQRSVTATARAIYAMRRAWKSYHQCYAAVLGVYRDVFDLGAGKRVFRKTSF